MATLISSPYTPEAKAEIMEHVCAQVSTGRSVHRILADDEGMPSPDTFWRWIAADGEASDNLVRAREHGIEARLEECIDIADNATGDVYITEDRDGNPVAKINGFAPRRAALMVETRMKMAAMLKPRKYGPKVDVTSGGEALKPTQLTDNRVQALVTMAIERAAAARAQLGEEDKA